MRDERYIDIPGSKTHELPPLLVHSAVDGWSDHSPREDAADLTSVMPEAEDMLAWTGADEAVFEQRKLDLA